MIYLTGDVHGDKGRFAAAVRAGIRREDTLVVCGDFGFLWKGGEQEERLLRWIGKRSYRVVFVDGCNENHKKLAEYPVEELGGAPARHIGGNLYELLRGEVYELEGKRLFAFGGGNPVEEFAPNRNDPLLLPTDGEIARAWETLEKAGNRVDLIVTHDAPGRLRQFLAPNSLEEVTHLHAFLEEVGKRVEFRRWYFGKYHADRMIPPHYQMLFTSVIKFEP